MLRTLVVLAVVALAAWACDTEKGMVRWWPDSGTDAGSDASTDTDTDTDTEPCAPDEIHDADHNLCWSACPLGMDVNGTACDGTATEYSGAAAQTACSGSRRLPTLDDFRGLLDNCTGAGCDSCADSPDCADLFLSDVHGLQLWSDDSCTAGGSPDAGAVDGLEAIDLGAGDWSCVDEIAPAAGIYAVCVSDAS